MGCASARANWTFCRSPLDSEISAAVEQRRDLEQGDRPPHSPLELRPRLAVPAGDLERVDLHHPFIGKELADEQSAFLLQAVPA